MGAHRLPAAPKWAGDRRLIDPYAQPARPPATELATASVWAGLRADMQLARPIFVALEGIDGSGTTTQVADLVRRFSSHSLASHRTFEPSSGEIGQLARRCLRAGHPLPSAALGLLFAADRIQHHHDEIAPRIATGQSVFCDRYLLSSFAYQSLDLPLDWLREIHRFAPRPDLTILLDVDPEVAFKRVQSRRAGSGEAEERFDQLETQRKLALRYRELTDLIDDHPIAIVDGNRSIHDVGEALDSTCLKYFGISS